MRRIQQVALIEPRPPGIHVFTGIRLPRLGLPILATQLERMGVKARAFVESLAPIDWQYVRESQAVFLSAVTSTANRTYALAAEAKAQTPGITTVVGGPHATFLPEEALATGAVDYAFRGEADSAVPDLLAVLSGEAEIETCPGLSGVSDGGVVHATDRPPAHGLEGVPQPDFRLVAGQHRMPMEPMEFCRGCPHGCEFCSVVSVFGRACRHQTIDAALDQLERKAFIERTLGLKPRPVFVYDDNHTANREWAKGLWEAAVARGLAPPFVSMQTRVDVTQDLDLMAVLRRANCGLFFWGIESIDNETLKAAGKRQTVEQSERALAVARRFGMRVHGMFVVGFEGDTPDTVRRTTDWALRHGLSTIQLMVLTPLPGTRVATRLAAEGRITDTNWDHYDAQHVVFQPAATTRARLQLAVISGMARFYSWPRVAALANRCRWTNAYMRAQGHRVLRAWLRAAENRAFLRGLEAAEPLELRAVRATR
jgi:anaerobic magnesium-protoporphyrin IX monomethyl ester cyclase